MKNKIKVICAILFLNSYLTNAQVSSEYDHSFNFSQVKTYCFVGWEKESDQIMNEFQKKAITDSFMQEFSERGMNYVSDCQSADVAITLFVVVDPQTSTTAYTDFMGSYGYPMGGFGYGYRYGMGGMPMNATTTYNTVTYNEGNLIVDMYKVDTKKLLWEGSITTDLSDNSSRVTRKIPKYISRLMRKYPGY